MKIADPRGFGQHEMVQKRERRECSNAFKE